MCKKAYSRLSMLTKLKYAGVSTEDLLDIFKLFIRSIVEYCSVVFHSSLTVEDAGKIEQVQKTCLKVILGEMYVSYSAALEMTGLLDLSTRREDRCLNFALKCVRHPRNNRLFPFRKEGDYDEEYLRKKETFEVNFASGEIYKKSAIPYCQRLLNSYVTKQK